MSYAFFFYCYGHHRDLHSFPTRRSSDLVRSGRPAPITLPIRHLRYSVMGLSRSSRRSGEHTSELQSHSDLVCRLLLEKKKNVKNSSVVTSPLRRCSSTVKATTCRSIKSG